MLSCEPITSKVATAKPTLVIRSGPGVSYDRLGAVDNGTTVYLECYQPGELIQPSGGRDASDVWSRITVNGVTGFVSNAYLETAGDHPYFGYQLPQCG